MEHKTVTTMANEPKLMPCRKPVDKSKRSNRRCLNCTNWKGDYIPNELYLTAKRPCVIGGNGKYYYQICKKFDWNPEKEYVDGTAK